MGCIDWFCQERVEERHSFNDIELMGRVWSVEYIKQYPFGKSSTVIANHRALLSTMKDNRYIKSHKSRFTCIDADFFHIYVFGIRLFEPESRPPWS